MSVKSIIHALIKPLINSEVLIFADQNSPRPALPYWTMRLSAQRAIGRDVYGQGVNDDGDQLISGVREITVQVQRIGVDSDSACGDLQNELSKTTVMEAWRIQNIALYDVGDVLNIPHVMDKAQLEPRASIDLFVRFGTELLDRVGQIETVEIEANYGDDLDNPNPDLTEIITVVL